MTAHDLRMRAVEFRNLATSWQRMADDAARRDDNAGREYCAAIAAELNDRASGLEHRAQAVRMAADGREDLDEHHREIAAEYDASAARRISA